MEPLGIHVMGEPAGPPRASVRLLVSSSLAAMVILLLWRFAWPVRLIAGWDVLSAAQLLFAWDIVRTCGPEQTRRAALHRDPGQKANWVVLLLSIVGLILGVLLLRIAGALPSGASIALIALCLLAVVSAWLLLHVYYGARYARLYYRLGGLQFPEGRTPDYWDFLYFAFTLGMCFQVSDVVTAGTQMRRTVLGHALLSFAFNTSILSVTISLVSGLLGP